MFNREPPKKEHRGGCVCCCGVCRLESNPVSLAQRTEVVGPWQSQTSHQFERVHDGLWLWSQATHTKEFRLQHGEIKTANVVPHQNGSVDEVSQFVRNLRKPGFVADVFVVDAVDVAGIKRNPNTGFHELLNVHRRAVGKRPNEGVLDDAVVVGGHARGFKVEGKHLLALEKVLCHAR